MNKEDCILITGSKGFVGKNLINELTKQGYKNLITHDRTIDLTNQESTKSLFKWFRPKYVFNLAGKIGGIQKNISDPFGFLYDNVMIQANVIKNCIDFKVEKCLNLGSSCIYPKDFIQPLKEEYLLKDSLEKTNEGYSLAKIVGLKLTEYSNKQFQTNFISLMPSNLYGPHDHFNLDSSHALAATILKVHNAVQNKESFVNVWGNGCQKREWFFVNDLVDCMIWSMNNLKNTETFLNVGTGVDITMNELTSKIMVEYYAQKDYHNLEIKNDTSKPNGMMEKRLDVSKINNLGWKAKTDLDQGIRKTIKYFLETYAK